MFYCDSHTHSCISPDSEATLLSMAQAAMDLGLDELCVTDHCDLLSGDGQPVNFFDWEGAKAQYLAVRPQVEGKLNLRFGLELGSAVYEPEVARNILAVGGDELDFVLGSLHNWIGEEGNIDLFFTDFHDNEALGRRSIVSTLDNTWRLVSQCPDCYDSLAHIVYPLRYLRRDGLVIDLDDYEEQIRAIFTEVARTDHALEVNTCRGRDVDVWLPILCWFKDCGGRLVTLGSDAHRPADVAKGLQAASELVQAAGFAHVTTYRHRKPVYHDL
jgi:histidinol-phosphatase (PHP family)